MAEKTASKQEIFLWEGLDRQGKKVKGEGSSTSVTLMQANLRRQGINPTKVRKKPKPLLGGQKKIKAEDVTVFARQLATMMSAGVPLVQAFEIVARGHENPSMGDLLIKVKNDIEGGTTLAEALSRHPKHFDRLFVNLVAAGEQSGALETLLDKIATYKEKTESTKKKIKKALVYPSAIVVVAIGVSAILLLFVVPQFESLFQGFGADLPALTRMVINLSEYLQQSWYIVLFSLGAIVTVFVQALKRSPRLQYVMDVLMLKIPVVGDILRKGTLARFARTLATMFAAGVPLVEAMESVANAAGNAVYRDAVLRMRDDVAAGTQLQTTMKNQNVFPNMAVQMTAIGEESGSLDTMLTKVADFYEEEVDAAVDALSSLLEPLIMVVLGGIVGTLVIAMYLPIFKMGQAI